MSLAFPVCLVVALEMESLTTRRALMRLRYARSTHNGLRKNFRPHGGLRSAMTASHALFYTDSWPILVSLLMRLLNKSLSRIPTPTSCA